MTRLRLLTPHLSFIAALSPAKCDVFTYNTGAGWGGVGGAGLGRIAHGQIKVKGGGSGSLSGAGGSAVNTVVVTGPNLAQRLPSQTSGTVDSHGAAL